MAPPRLTPQPQVSMTTGLKVTPIHSNGGESRCVPCRLLKGAAQRVAGDWKRRPRSTGPDEVAELLGLLSTCIHQVIAAIPPVYDPRLMSPLGRRLLDLLRAGVVEGCTPGSRDTDLLPMFAAIEKVRSAIEPNWAQTFAAHLSGADGLALLMDVAHDLRSPLTSILVLAETLQRGHSGDVNDIQRRQLGLIYTAALGLSSVASDIIEFTQGGEQLIEQEPALFSVCAILESVRDIVRPIAEEKRLTVRLLPPTVDVRIGHSVAVSRILLNLTTNALKFTDHGYVEVVATEKGPNIIEFAVRDSGKGIDAESVATLFQPLRRKAGRRGQHFSQTGLGLTICRKLATALHSELKVESRIGWGTRFYFELELPPAPVRRPGRRLEPRAR
jgi:signal transduction histidine kinase